jgi:hypothetical protein
MESLNSVMIRSGMSKYDRGMELRRIAQQQIAALNGINPHNSGKKTIEQPKKVNILQKAQEIANPELSTFNKALKHALNYNPKEDKK